MQAATKSQLTDSSGVNTVNEALTEPELMIMGAGNDGNPVKKTSIKPEARLMEVCAGATGIPDGSSAGSAS